MKQRIIIIGGMGPQASLELHRRILRQHQQTAQETARIFRTSFICRCRFLILSPMNRGAAKPWKLS